MKQLKLPLFALLFLSYVAGCSSVHDGPWPDAIPQKSPYIIIPNKDATISSVLQSSYAPFLDDITSSASQLLSQVDSTAGSPLRLNAIMLYPGSKNRLQTVWLIQNNKGLISKLTKKYHKRFAQNQYYFDDVIIYKINLKQRILFAVQLGNNLLLSESSLGVEDAIRAYTNRLPRAEISGLSLRPGSIIMNTPSTDIWINQMAKVAYRPYINHSMKGTGPALLTITKSGKEQNSEYEFSGTIPLDEANRSKFVRTFSEGNAPITLDRYISSNAAAFGLFRKKPSLAPPGSLPDTTSLDSTLLADKVRYGDLAESMGQNFALVMYAQSGFLATGEHLFIRELTDAGSLKKQLAGLADQDMIQRSGSSYYIQSRSIAKMIGSNLCNFRSFYLHLTNDAAVISKRKGLAEMVSSDRRRRRTMYYEQEFRDMKSNLPHSVSGLFVTNSNFKSFINSFLSKNNYSNVLTSKFDLLTVSAVLSNDKKSLAFDLQTHRSENTNNPYKEKWFIPTDTGLSGKPILADIGGGPQKEIIFATKSGDVYALAADGTVVFKTSTNGAEPVGSPVAYDWYSTNENVILIAAGNKIFAWDDNGKMLPKFPFQLRENITTPLVIDDLDQNRLPNAIVATANRKLHVINERGNDISGWPVRTNADIRTKVLTGKFMGSSSVIAFAENGVHAWSSNGTIKNGFPKFLGASLKGSPVLYDGQILANAADGNLYKIGPKKLFSDSLNVNESGSDSDIQGLYASNSALVGSPSVSSADISNNGRSYSGTTFLTMSSNGSIFVFSKDGRLQLTKNMGQPAASSFSAFFTDINRNGQKDIVALANYGRLYVWQAKDGKRIYSVPSSGMTYPVIADINGDGYKELIAHTKSGLRCWTIFGK